MRTWHMESWKNNEVFTIEGREAVLWTDLVDAGNLDYHLWPCLSAVSERLRSDLVTNNSANGHVYVRLDIHRWRMLFRGIKVQPSFCIKKLK
ncbi:beta-hexosaminidase subunit beta-like [Galleria mellonella]|uniref:Beta-hexosaminidase subunit beta-like n=1 Tax=Galleria mellonella TaxID=7137 RepID=A0ABM3N5Z4_GALME|nr:beta-hexosaminidase subunit beta-like [Galleria mellonella]